MSRFFVPAPRPIVRALSLLLLAGSALFVGCNKSTKQPTNTPNNQPIVETVNTVESGKPSEVYNTYDGLVTVAAIQPIEGSSFVEVFFNENTQVFTVKDPANIAVLKVALATSARLAIKYDPRKEVLVSAELSQLAGRAVANNANMVVSDPSSIRKVDLSTMDDNLFNDAQALGILNTTDPGLNNVIPDFQTAQMMFDYITRQCCALPGPYAIDYCIPFQYCYDGCYARAHKMNYIINNRYKYSTKKIFSFANSGGDRLCVQGQKWGGCCIRWWYHVAPLVTIQMPTGPKAYVFDPAMFNQPVPLATWLRAQENPACAGSYTPNVTMINVQPNSSYTPAGSSGYTFSTDPTYSSTNFTLTDYRYRTTCL